MKFLVRGKTNFLEAEFKDRRFKPTNREVDPRTLVHFGTDIINSMDDEYFLSLDHIGQLQKEGVDYVFISRGEDVESGQRGKVLNVVTAYKKK